MKTLDKVLLALFMGLVYYDDKGFLRWTDAKNIVEIKHLNFDEDWNLLMPIVEKINSFTEKDYNFIYTMILDPLKCTVSNSVGDVIVSNEHGSTFIEVVCTTCLMFVKWYNEQH